MKTYESVSKTTQITIFALSKEFLSVPANPTHDSNKVCDVAGDFALEKRRVANDDVGVVCLSHKQLRHHCTTIPRIR